MRRFLKKCFNWSWLLTLPTIIIASYLSYQISARFSTYGIKYQSFLKSSDISLESISDYETTTLYNKSRAALLKQLGKKTQLRQVHLFIPQSELSTLESNMPHSGYDFVKGKILNNGQLNKIKFKYRGDNTYRWAWNKKCIRVKTKKSELFEGLRSFNLLAPRSEEQLNNYLSYKLAAQMNLMAPQTEMVRVNINGKDQGIFTLVEKIEEMTLRRNGRMPGDIYKGENVNKDGFAEAHIQSLFETHGLWEKSAANNHYEIDSTKPLQRLIQCVQNQDSPEYQQQLSKLMDMDAWGRFSVFQMLTQSKHSDESHNWIIYYDPWTQKIIPIPWDTMGWFATVRVPEHLRDFFIASTLHGALFKNGDFLRARENALSDFLESSQNDEFIEFADDTIKIIAEEIKTDPNLKPANPDKVIEYLEKLSTAIRDTFDRVETEFINSKTNYSYNFQNNTMRISMEGPKSVKRIRLEFDGTPEQPEQTSVIYKKGEDLVSVDISGSVRASGKTLIITEKFLYNLAPVKLKENIKKTPGHYQINFEVATDKLKLLTVSIDDGSGWQTIGKSKKDIELTKFNILHSPVKEAPNSPIDIWSGEIFVNEIINVSSSVIIEPGTQIFLAPGAAIIFREKVIANGREELPIQFLPLEDDQLPWGTIALQGQQTSGSRFSHCEFSRGSGIKDDLYEYTAMFSIHDSSNIEVSNSQFSNSTLVDDMAHAVYTDIKFENCSFSYALSDALDIDISNATIINCSIEHSGNDAIDLMSSRAVIRNTQLLYNGDKGISVGEGSMLFAANNFIQGNLIGIQSKDGSKALLINQTITDNQTALDAYKKNWRYGTGGTIIASKTVFQKNQTTATADKKSRIVISDSYVETTPTTKRIKIINSDLQEIKTAHSSDLLPELKELPKRAHPLLTEFQAEIEALAAPSSRGTHN